MKNQFTAVFITIALVLILGWLTPGQALAGWDVHISVPLFGLFYEPPLVVAPAPYGYSVPAPTPVPAPAGTVFHGGYWYLPSGGNWYIAAQAGGPWSVIAIERIPYAVISGPVLCLRRRPITATRMGRRSASRSIRGSASAGRAAAAVVMDAGTAGGMMISR